MPPTQSIMAAGVRPHHLLAFDLGAGSGRAVLGSIEQGALTLREVHRFPNHPIELAGHLFWNFAGLFEEIKEGLRKCAALGIRPGSLGVDTWGVDFGFLASDGSVAGLPYSYRDRRTDGCMEEFFERMRRERVYALTGIQFMQFNSLFQLFCLARDKNPVLRIADKLLFMPDLFTYLLTGVARTEYTVATTSQMINPVTRGWEPELFRAVGLPLSLIPAMIMPGSVVGTLRGAAEAETGIGPVPVVATASHDTASAVAAVPAEGENWAYISSGTWSLMGVELDAPVMTTDALSCNFTNEGGVGGRVRFLKNIAGLWLLQECKRVWEKSRNISYDELMKMAAAAEPFRTVIDPDAPAFLSPADMTEAIRRYALAAGQPAPETIAEFVRSILEGLALKYRFVLEQLRRVAPRSIETLHIIGGGAQNRMLCQFAADATGLPVIAGPVEATAVGNILVQALGTGLVGSLEDLRRIVCASFTVEHYQPEGREQWDRAYQRFLALPKQP